MAVVSDKGLMNRFLMWRLRHIKENQFIVILSILVGIVTGLASVLLKNMVHFTHTLVTERLQVDTWSWVFFACPFIGIVLTWLFVKYFVKDNISHGVTKVLYAISRQNSIIKPHNNYSSMVASTLTIGFGGSVGTEATIVLTGASIGSSLARLFHMNYKIMTLMIGCGAAGAIAGIFKAPIAGIVFTMEVLMLDLTMASLVPLMFTAITSYVITYFFMGTGFVFSYQITDSFLMVNFPYYVLLGLFTGFLSVYFVRMNLRIEQFLSGISNPFKKMAIGGALLGLVIFIFPPLYGEGYTVLDDLMAGNSENILNNTYFFNFRENVWMVLLFVAGLVFVKVIATAFTNGSGGVGGVFAPSLFTGGVAGFLLAMLLNMSGIRTVSESHFVLAGMAGVMSGVMKAPLTAMFLIAEISGGYALFLPLMLTSVIGYLTSKGMEPYSIYARRLAQKGDLLTHNKDKAVLTLLNTDSVIEKDFQAVSPEMSLGDMVKVIARSPRNTFPVLDERGVLLGIVLLDNIRNIMFRPELYNRFHVSKFMVSAPAKIVLNTPMDKIMQIFDETKAWNLPVVDGNGHYVGFMSKSKIFNSYREVLVENFSGD